MHVVLTLMDNLRLQIVVVVGLPTDYRHLTPSMNETQYTVLDRDKYNECQGSIQQAGCCKSRLSQRTSVSIVHKLMKYGIPS